MNEIDILAKNKNKIVDQNNLVLPREIILLLLATFGSRGCS